MPPKGIVSPFASPTVERAAPKAQAGWKKQHEDDTTPEQRTTIRLVGVRYRLNVVVSGPLDAAEGQEYARHTLGEALKASFRIPEATAAFYQQAVYPAAPARTHIPVKLGEFTVYTATTTFDPKAVEAQFIDRIVAALSSVRRTSPAVNEILDQYNIKMVTT